MTTILRPQVLFHVELRIASALIRAAVIPEVPFPSTGFAVAKWDRDLVKAEAAQTQISKDYIAPALACIMNAAELQSMLDRCGETAVIRISLERPNDSESGDGQPETTPCAA